MQIEMRRNGFRGSAGQRNERFLCRLFRSGLLHRRCCFRVDPNCRGRDSCGTGAAIKRLLLLLRLRRCAGLAFLRYRTLGGGFCCRVSLQPARFLRYRSRHSHAACGSRGGRFPALPLGRSGGNRRSLCASLRYRLFCAAALCGNWALRSVLFCRTRCIRPRGRAWAYQFRGWKTALPPEIPAPCGRRMLRCRSDFCWVIIPFAARRLLTGWVSAGLLGAAFLFCCVIWVFPFVETRVVCCTGWVIASADGCALFSCRTGRWHILRAARLLHVAAPVPAVSRAGGMRIWLFSCRPLGADVDCTPMCGAACRFLCHAEPRRSRRSRMICCWPARRRNRSEILHRRAAALMRRSD